VRKETFREVEAFDYKCEAFIKITRIAMIFSGIEAFSKHQRLFKIISREIEAFSFM
jgi:hypothetical protein